MSFTPFSLFSVTSGKEELEINETSESQNTDVAGLLEIAEHPSPLVGHGG